jgi:cytochrome c551/c552
MQQHTKTLKFALVGTVGSVAAGVLVFSIVQFAAPKAEATPAIAQGKACNTCHTSSSPSKSDLKK